MKRSPEALSGRTARHWFRLSAAILKTSLSRSPRTRRASLWSNSVPGGPGRVTADCAHSPGRPDNGLSHLPRRAWGGPLVDGAAGREPACLFGTAGLGSWPRDASKAVTARPSVWTPRHETRDSLSILANPSMTLSLQPCGGSRQRGFGPARKRTDALPESGEVRAACQPGRPAWSKRSSKLGLRWCRARNCRNLVLNAAELSCRSARACRSRSSDTAWS